MTSAGQRYADLVQRLLGVKGDVPTDAEMLTPTFQVNTPESVDTYLQRGELLAHAQNRIGPVAAQFAKLRFTNPTGSGVLVHVRRLFVRGGSGVASTVVNVALAGEPAGGANRFGIFADTRRVPVTSRCFVNSQTGVGQDIAPATLAALASSVGPNETELPSAWILLPGWSLYVEGGVVNTEVGINVEYVERQPLPEELRDRT